MTVTRRSWPNPEAPSGRPIGLVNAINAPDVDDNIWTHETPLPMEMFPRFTEFLITHKLPNGQETTVPTLSSTDLQKFMTPYNQWAPAPYNTSTLRGDAAVTRFSTCLSGLPDMDDLQSIMRGAARASDIESKIDPELNFCKQRIWSGTPPICARRWAEKCLDAPENLDLAVEYILRTCDMVHFSMPTPARKLRAAYNRAHDVLSRFDAILDAHYAATATPRPSPVARVADLWADYFFTHVQLITHRLHTWAFSHLEELTSSLLSRIQAAPTAPGASRVSPQQDALLSQFERLTRITQRIDMALLFPLVGLKNALPRWRGVTSPPIVNWGAYIRSHGATPLEGNYPVDITQRDEVFFQRQARLVREELGSRQGTMQGGSGDGGNGEWQGSGVVASAMRVRNAHAKGRRELRGEGVGREVEEEVWVRGLKRLLGRGVGEGRAERAGARGGYERWGFVAYRVWYGHSEEEWEMFVRRFEADVKNWGEGVAGVEGLKEKMEIRWLDGREHAIAEGDVAGVRKHFAKLSEDKSGELRGLVSPAFLVADKSSIDSYLQEAKLPGQTLVDEADLGPFILVGEDHFEAQTRQARAGFDGTVRVLGSMLVDDVWPMMWWTQVSLETIWDLATLHPSCVYVGLLVQSQIEGWKKFQGVRDAVVKKAWQWKRDGRLNS
ncbi:hypothetical protein QBC34DRAFT_314059 [Podospora aff. communis PSN243]|uniref:Uncharacterized protein n=1 Tax=Podospora aff. communis PSN243 TaxID=3040156 RepID=A0AAV9G0G5_9PEZI|nr:hypothetical protein QBC34DRAFT_314059 [Podospora aff. communis PSN243]